LPFGLALSSDGRFAAAGGEEGFRLWRLPEGEPVGPARPFYTTSLAFSPDSRLLAVGGGTDKIQILDTETGALLEPLSVHRENVFGIAFGVDGETLAAIFNDGSVGVWDVPLRQPLTDPLHGVHDFGLDIAFDQEHGVLLSGDEGDAGGSAVLWSPLLWSSPRAEPLIERLCAVAGRNMTAAEWQELAGSHSPRRTCDRWPAP
jgi:WD40 repeat protein